MAGRPQDSARTPGLPAVPLTQQVVLMANRCEAMLLFNVCHWPAPGVRNTQEAPRSDIAQPRPMRVAEP